MSHPAVRPIHSVHSRRSSLRVALPLAGLASLAGCAHAPASAASFRWTPGVKPAVYFPLAPGTAWSYDALDPSTGSKVLVVSRVQSRTGNRAVFSLPPDPLEYEDTGEAIVAMPSGKAILRTPIEKGAHWPAGAGTASIRAVDGVADTAAGRFAGCVVVEEVAPDRRIVTWFAPRVGPVKLEIYARQIPGQIPGEIPGGNAGGSASAATEILVSRAGLRSFHDGATPAP